MGYDFHLDPAKYIYSHCRALHRHSKFQLVGGVDPDPQQRQLFERTYQAPAFADIEQALDGSSPDLVVIAIPTELHAETLRQVLNRTRPKVVLCEKPLAGDVRQAREILKACAAQNVSLYVNYIRRSDPGVIEIKRRLDAGEINGPFKGVAFYTKGFLHNGSHLLNLLEYWFGSATAWIPVECKTIQNSSDAKVDVRISFEKGHVMFLAASPEDAFTLNGLELLMGNGRLRYEHGGERIEWSPTMPHAHIEGYTVLSKRSEIIASGMDRYQWHVMEQLAAAMTGQSHNLCSGEVAMKTLDTMQAILESQR